MKELTNMHPEYLGTGTQDEKTLLENDITFEDNEIKSDDESKNEILDSLGDSVSNRTSEENRTTTIEAPLTNGLPKNDSNMKLEMLKITLDTTPVVENGSLKVDNNNVKYSSQPDNAEEGNEANAGGKPYVCYICDKEFSRNSSLKCHIRLHLEGPVSILRRNGARVSNDAYLSSDKDDPSKRVPIERDDEGLATPTGTSTDDGPYACDLCGRLFNCKRGLYRHMGYHNKRPDSSSKMDDTGSDIDLSLADENSIDGVDESAVFSPSVFECPQCGKDFKSIRAVKIHTSHVHKEERLDDDSDLFEMVENTNHPDDENLSFNCDYCGRRFHSKRAKSIHTAHVHKLNGSLPSTNSVGEDTLLGDSDDLFECEFCGKYFKSRRAVSIHASHVHRGDKGGNADHDERSSTWDDEDQEFECDYCDRVFRTQRARSIHAVSAHGLSGKQLEKMKLRRSPIPDDSDPSLECVVCERKFTCVRTYELHTRGVCGTAQILNGSYVYVCQECPKSFSHPKSMSRHMRVHRLPAGEDSFDDVSDGEPEEDGQDDHSDDGEDTNLEDGTKEYKCSLCDKAYITKQALAGHVKVHNRANGDTIPLTKVTPSQVVARASEKQTPTHVTVPRVAEKQSSETKEKARIYVCKYCDRSFPASVGYAGHMKAHKMEIAADLASKVSLAKSATTSSPLSKRAASPSRKRVVSESASEDDEADNVVVKSEKLVSCRYCPRKFSTPAQLGGHVRQHMADMKTSPRSHTPVRTNVVEDKVYKCDACMQTFTYLSELKSHTTNGCNRKRSFGSRNEEELFKCEYCEQTFLLQCHLQKHMKSRCNVNDLGSESADDFTNGDSNDTPSNKRIRKSTYMDSMYEYEPMIKSRRSSQKLLKPYECEYCGNGFTHEDSLLEHVRIHMESEEIHDEYFEENEPDFPAHEQFVIQNLNGEEEGFVFEQYDDSQGYQCNECEETYRDKLQMIIHMAFHFSNRLPNDGRKSLTIKADATLLAPYKCHFCEERFVNKKFRKRHLCKRHSEDIFKCDICEKLFLYKKTLTQHCKQHMIETKYHCEYCLKCFTSKWFLKRHTKKQCEKKLALEEMTQAAIETDPLSMGIHSEVDGADTFEELVKEEVVYFD